MDINAINAINSADNPALTPASGVLTRSAAPLLATQGKAAALAIQKREDDWSAAAEANQSKAETPEQSLTEASPAPEAVAVPEAVPPALPDPMPSLLQGVYRAPTFSHLVTGAFAGDPSRSNAQALLHVMAPTPVAAASGHAQGRPSNFNTYALSPATTESLAAHAARIATGKPPPLQQIVSDTHEAFVGHSIDLFA